jgi:KRAB domain-containing zinc finger protein
MENEAFIHQDQRVSFVKAFFDVHNKADDLSAIPMSDVKICGSCAVLLENAYVLRKVCKNAEQLAQNYCRFCQLENIKEVPFWNMNTEMFVHNHKSITFVEGFSAVNNYSVEYADNLLNSENIVCKNCAVLLESAYLFQKMCRAATDILHQNYSTPKKPIEERSKDESKSLAAPFSEQRILGSDTKACSKLATVKKLQPRKRKIEEIRMQKVVISYRCKKCPKELKSKIGLETHRRIMHQNFHSIRGLYVRVSKRESMFRSIQEQQNFRYCCQNCDKKFQTKNCLSLHIQRVHLKLANQNQKKLQTKTKHRKNPSVCIVCGKSYGTLQNLIYHNESVHLKLRYRCDKCPKVYQNKKSFRNHYQSEHLNQPFVCQLCPKTFKTPGRLSWHKKNVHLKTLLNCEQCTLAYSSPVTLRKHIQSEHQTRHDCQDCGKVFKNAIGLSTHKLEVHLKRLSKCQYCSKEFKARQSLLRHIRYVHVHVPIEYHCKECLKVFKKRGSLNRHVRRVHQNKKYACKDCDKIFVLELSLKRHYDKVHLKKLFQCEKCPEKFKTFYQLKIHFDALHLGKQFSCKICNQIYVGADYLRTHIKNIHDKALYSCDQCSKVYTASSSLLDHKKIKHLNKRWSCKNCEKVFKSRKGHSNHIRLKLCPALHKK